MHWRLKCLAFRASARVPGRDVLYRAVQQHVTKGHVLTVTPAVLRLHAFHTANYRRVHPSSAVEFGGGRDFLSPLLLSQAGATEIRVYDIKRLSSAEQINFTIRQLRSMVPGDWPEVSDAAEDLARKYRIRYCAPGDVRKTALPDASVGFVYSTSTLEHIPPVDLEAIFRETVRISAPGAIFSHVIDYTDHYRYGDASVPMFNFYRYAEQRWRLWNPRSHYQNRLRHSDFETLFERLGLISVELSPRKAPEHVIETTPISREFERYSRSDLLTEAAYCVLTRS